jgi:hypothetical protein
MSEQTQNVTNPAPSPATTESPAEVPELSSEDALSAALGAITPESDDPTEQTSDEDPGGPAKKPEEAPKAEPKPAKGSLDELFTEEALSTAQGVKAAREALQRHRRKVEGFNIRLEKKARTWETKKAEELQALQNDRATARFLQAQLGVLRTGSATQVLESLGQLTGKTGRQVFEEITQAVLRDGKTVKVSPEVEALRSELAELRGFLEQGQQRQNEAASEAERAEKLAFVDRRQQEIVAAASNAESYPHLSHYASLGRGNEIATYATQLKRAAREQGQNLDDAAALGIIESELAQLVPTAGAPKAGATRNTGQDPAKKPDGGQSRRAQTVSIAPSSARSHSTVRDMTDEERLEDLKRDTDFINSLFG